METYTTSGDVEVKFLKSIFMWEHLCFGDKCFIK